MGDSGGQEQSLLTWLAEQFDRDEETRASTRRVLGELLVFYLLVFVGFGGLWLTWRSNAQLRRLKAAAAAVVRDQRAARFDPEDGAKMYGMF